MCHIKRAAVLAVGGCFAWSPTAEAHVKWFSPYDVSKPPREVGGMLNTDFALLLTLSLLLLLCGCLIEALDRRKLLLRALNSVTGPLDANGDVLIRAACGFFLIALWTMGGILLTPEIKTDQAWVSWLQLAIAGGLLWRPTMIFSALGLVVLFAMAVRSYGIFHLMDYPIFIGIAAYLFLTGSGKSFFGVRPIDLLRWLIAITLMWASVEKWAYPHWSYPIVEARPNMTLGFTRDFFMLAAGIIEFALSFALLLGPLSRRVASAVLLGMFTAAIGPFGKIDAVGHAPIIGAVAALVGDNSEGGALFSFDISSNAAYLRSLAYLFFSYCGMIVVFVVAYYGLQSEMYGGVFCLPGWG